MHYDIPMWSFIHVHMYVVVRLWPTVVELVPKNAPHASNLGVQNTKVSREASPQTPLERVCLRAQ